MGRPGQARPSRAVPALGETSAYYTKGADVSSVCYNYDARRMNPLWNYGEVQPHPGAKSKC